MKVLAKQAMKGSAEGRGVSWDKHVQQLAKTAELQAIKEELEDRSLQYPDYYLKPFHAYSSGNLEWLAAYEVEPATYAMGIRTFKDQPEWTPQQCFVELRSRITGAIMEYHSKHSLPLPAAILDVGCSTGISTRWLAQAFPGAAAVTGIDASPYFLAVAEWERRKAAAAAAAGAAQPAGLPPITYRHALVERSGLPAGSQQLVAFNFIIHECPQAAIRDFVSEAKRLLPAGGVVAFVDNNPKSKTIQNLPPAIFTLMKSTEPWSDEYYSFDLEAALREAGFRDVVTVETDHRHRAVMGIRV